VEDNRSNRAPVALCADDVHGRVERTKSHADRRRHSIGVNPRPACPRERDSMIEESHGLAISLWRSVCEERKRSGDIGWGVQRSIGALLEPRDNIGKRSLERPHRALSRVAAATVGRVFADVRSRKDRSSHPDRDQKKRDCAQREDCASPQAPASYIQTTD
jgi:hypothetical protein